MKRKNKTEYYKIYFEKNIKKTKALWKGISLLVYIKPSNKSDISILDTNGDTITDPLKKSNCFNKYFVNVGSDIENKIPKSNVPHTDYLYRICINKSFYLKPASKDEIIEIINWMDLNKALGPHSIPIYIIQVTKEFFSNCFVKIVNLSFESGIFPDLCKLVKVVPYLKKKIQ